LKIASSCSVVLVDHTAEASSASCRSMHRDDDGQIVVGGNC
jgi:RecA-family ATPase